MTRREWIRAALPAAALVPEPLVHQPPERPRLTRMLCGGDVMLSRYVGELARIREDPSWPFREIAPAFASADIAFVNLESPFSDREPIGQSRMIFRAEREMIDGLRLAGIDIVSTANNHARDCGSYGVGFTIEWLERHGIAAVGTAAHQDVLRLGRVIERNGIRFGFLAFTYDQSNGNHREPDARIAMLDIAGMQHDVERLHERVDAVIVSMHAGTEYAQEPNSQQVSFARAAIDAGARVVIGHHPHVIQRVETYRRGVIFYSLGNLIFDQFQRRETQEGLIAEVVFEGAVLREYRAHLVRIRNTVPVFTAPVGELLLAGLDQRSFD